METISPQLICTICHEALSRDNDGLLATQCGHLFHKECLTKWFQTNMSMDSFRNIPRDEMVKGSCPVCCTPQWMKRCVKIFPSVDDQEANSIKYHVKSLKKTLAETDDKLADAEMLIKKQKMAITFLTKSENRGVSPAPARFTTPVRRKLIKASDNSTALELLANKKNVQTEENNKQPFHHVTTKTEQRSGPTMSLRSTTLSQYLVESTTATSRTVGTRIPTPVAATTRKPMPVAATTRIPTPVAAAATSSTRRPLLSSTSSVPIRRTTASRIVR